MVKISKYFTAFTVSPCNKYDNFAFESKSMRFNSFKEMEYVIKPMYENNDILILYHVYSKKGDDSIIVRFENISLMGYIP